MTDSQNRESRNQTGNDISGLAVAYSGLGGTEVIDVIERSTGAPRRDEIRIKVKAAAINPTDILLRQEGASGATHFPAVPGMDAAGTIDSIGSDVRGFKIGDEVMAVVNPRRPEGGGQAAYIVIPATSVVAIPLGVSVTQAATLPMNALTALFALELAALEEGRVVAVSGGAGHLAHCTIAAAKQQNLTVIADARKDEIELVRGYGADIVVERSDDFAQAVRKELPDGVDALIDTAVLAEASFPAIADSGLYIPVRGWNKGTAERGIRVIPVMVPNALHRTDLLTIAKGLVEKGAIKLRIAGEYRPDAVGKAQAELLAGGVRGRPVVVF